MDYKDLIFEMIKQINDDKLLKSIYYILQKVIGKGI